MWVHLWEHTDPLKEIGTLVVFAEVMVHIKRKKKKKLKQNTFGGGNFHYSPSVLICTLITYSVWGKELKSGFQKDEMCLVLSKSTNLWKELHQKV